MKCYPNMMPKSVWSVFVWNISGKMHSMSKLEAHLANKSRSMELDLPTKCAINLHYTSTIVEIIPHFIKRIKRTFNGNISFFDSFSRGKVQYLAF
jgi:hypothetical protein